MLFLDFDFGRVRDLERHRVFPQIGDGPPDSGGRDHLVALLQEQPSSCSPASAFLLRQNQHEIENDENEDERDQREETTPLRLCSPMFPAPMLPNPT
jgi:hypothetical protein